MEKKATDLRISANKKKHSLTDALLNVKNLI